ncbi:MAG: hypothetical protein EON95_08255 [Caulobacteraceae bacterium]|nr:hypothetical protein [Caulobacter sp.]RYF93620.1 MAG: hypothetical protein EON95_08255 [Caulobacteraceae bacterium]
MKTLLISATLLALAGASAVSAQPAGRLSDSQFIKAARCKGLAKADGVDTKAIDLVLKTNKRGRADWIVDKAMDAQDSAVSEARRADATRKAELAAEWNGACQAYGVAG